MDNHFIMIIAYIVGSIAVSVLFFNAAAYVGIVNVRQKSYKYILLIFSALCNIIDRLHNICIFRIFIQKFPYFIGAAKHIILAIIC